MMYILKTKTVQHLLDGLPLCSPHCANGLNFDTHIQANSCTNYRPRATIHPGNGYGHGGFYLHERNGNGHGMGEKGYSDGSGCSFFDYWRNGDGFGFSCDDLACSESGDNYFNRFSGTQWLRIL